MPKKSKLSTPEWIREGYDSPEEYAKVRQKAEPLSTSSMSSQSKGVKTGKSSKSGKIFKVRSCPKCKSDEVAVVLTGEEGKGAGEWECKKCKWVGRDINVKELSEDEMMEYLDSRGEEVA